MGGDVFPHRNFTLMDATTEFNLFLKPRGALRAILPASAEVNETPAHQKFRAWARCHGPGWRGLWRNLPPEGFAEVGTNIATVILTLHKPAT